MSSDKGTDVRLILEEEEDADINALPLPAPNSISPEMINNNIASLQATERQRAQVPGEVDDVKAPRERSQSIQLVNINTLQ